ncbi:carbon-nitrogen hydrolase family protein [Halosegnis rubeus]|uniref:Carbon-nitrogen hydrolase family protein n=1 Tax=Halosegnis rubeus TaxID=2212850 RepID=A0A5N5U358_9EURY|nr:carbon-nitrogen hydrolase family protein [Halosegnis rubeus]KAB7513729.1 carbon-nitrogen hydrolase family protein [Halosegnis rubeus]
MWTRPSLPAKLRWQTSPPRRTSRPWSTDSPTSTTELKPSLALESPIFDRLRAHADETETAVLVGCIEQRGGEYHNTPAYITPGGELTPYRKRNLWGSESERLTPGEERVVVDTPAGRTGLLTCYDLNFVHESAAFLDAGVDALFVSGAWPSTHAANWRLLARARALDGVRWVVACGRTGRKEVADARLSEYAGRSLVVRPDGVVAGELAYEPDTLVRTLDTGVLDSQRDIVGVSVSSE